MAYGTCVRTGGELRELFYEEIGVGTILIESPSLFQVPQVSYSEFGIKTDQVPHWGKKRIRDCHAQNPS